MMAGPDPIRFSESDADRTDGANMAEFNAADADAADSDTADTDMAASDVTDQDRAERDVTWLDADKDAAEDDPAEEASSIVNPAEPAEPAIPVVTAGDTPTPPQATVGTGVTGTGVTSTGVTSTGVTGTDLTSAGVNGNDERWHDVVAGFIDDPRGSVAEAAELVEAEVTSLIALLSRRRDTLGETWQTGQGSEAGSATEDLRLAIRGYRESSSQLAASVKALS
jgi:hypothetical protein